MQKSLNNNRVHQSSDRSGNAHCAIAAMKYNQLKRRKAQMCAEMWLSPGKVLPIWFAPCQLISNQEG